MSTKNTINLVLGDWSDDGHGKTETIVISTNLSKEEIEKGYKAGTKKVKKDFIKNYCSEYESNSMPFKDAKLFEKHGISFVGCETYEGEDYDPHYPYDPDAENFIIFDCSQFASIYLQIVKLGNPEFTYEIVTNSDIKIDGYGLFWA